MKRFLEWLWNDSLLAYWVAYPTVIPANPHAFVSYANGDASTDAKSV
jgi:hypothetical protein